MLDLNAISRTHYAWVERMGWHNKTLLESLALIASEIGEAAAECIGGFNRNRFGEELADIILRTVDLAYTESVDLNEHVPKVVVTWQTETAPERLAELLADYATWTNTVRTTERGPDFVHGMATVVARVIDLATAFDVDLHHEVQRKLAKNELRGTRGRII